MNNSKENNSLFEEIEVEEAFLDEQFRFDSNWNKLDKLTDNNFNLE